MQELLATDVNVFIAGQLGNQANLYHYFDKLIALTVDPEEHERRLRCRPKREVGDDEKNIQRRLETYSKQMAQFIASGFITVDNTGIASETVDHILQTVAE